jgi:hypothetical protein
LTISFWFSKGKPRPPYASASLKLLRNVDNGMHPKLIQIETLIVGLNNLDVDQLALILISI